MPLRVQAAPAFRQPNFLFFVKQSASSFLLADFPARRLRSRIIRVPAHRDGTFDAYGPHKRKQKTVFFRSCPAKVSMKDTVNMEEIHLNDTFKDPSAAGSHRSPAQHRFSTVVLSPSLAPCLISPELPFLQHVPFLLGAVTIAVCGAFIALVATAIPTLNAMRRAALSLERLVDMAREELPGTMAAVRLSGMEISDLTLELSDISQEISESVRSSARAVRAAEVGIRRMGSAAASQTLSLLQEHASGPVEAVKPVVATAAETTRQAMTQAHKAVLGLAGMPVLSNWIQRKKFEEQKKMEETMSSDASSV